MHEIKSDFQIFEWDQFMFKRQNVKDEFNKWKSPIELIVTLEQCFSTFFGSRDTVRLKKNLRHPYLA